MTLERARVNLVLLDFRLGIHALGGERYGFGIDRAESIDHIAVAIADGIQEHLPEQADAWAQRGRRVRDTETLPRRDCWRAMHIGSVRAMVADWRVSASST